MNEPRFSKEELVESSGVSERTIRYYIEEGLLPAARGRGRSAYYTTDHLERIAEIQDLQSRGLSLKEIAAQLRGKQLPAVDQEQWNRIIIHEDLELHVRHGAPESVQILVRRFRELAQEWFGKDFHDNDT